jgi:hypothetical protein
MAPHFGEELIFKIAEDFWDENFTDWRVNRWKI